MVRHEALQVSFGLGARLAQKHIQHVGHLGHSDRRRRPLNPRLAVVLGRNEFCCLKLRPGTQPVSQCGLPFVSECLMDLATGLLLPISQR